MNWVAPGFRGAHRCVLRSGTIPLVEDADALRKLTHMNSTACWLRQWRGCPAISGTTERIDASLTDGHHARPEWLRLAGRLSFPARPEDGKSGYYDDANAARVERL